MSGYLPTLISFLFFSIYSILTPIIDHTPTTSSVLTCNTKESHQLVVKGGIVQGGFSLGSLHRCLNLINLNRPNKIDSQA